MAELNSNGKKDLIELTSGLVKYKGRRCLRLTFYDTPEIHNIMGPWLKNKLWYKSLPETRDDIFRQERQVSFFPRDMGFKISSSQANEKKYLSVGFALDGEMTWLPRVSKRNSRVVSWNGEILVIAYKIIPRRIV